MCLMCDSYLQCANMQAVVGCLKVPGWKASCRICGNLLFFIRKEEQVQSTLHATGLQCRLADSKTLKIARA